MIAFLCLFALISSINAYANHWYPYDYVQANIAAKLSAAAYCLSAKFTMSLKDDHIGYNWNHPGSNLTKMVTVSKFFQKQSFTSGYITNDGSFLWIAMRGTSGHPTANTQTDIANNMNNRYCSDCYVHQGFQRVAEDCLDWVYTVVGEELAKNKNLNIVCTGHSLGGALTTLICINLYRWLLDNKPSEDNRGPPAKLDHEQEGEYDPYAMTEADQKCVDSSNGAWIVCGMVVFEAPGDVVPFSNVKWNNAPPPPPTDPTQNANNQLWYLPPGDSPSGWRMPWVTVQGFATPRLGNYHFASYLDSTDIIWYQTTHRVDCIPLFPAPKEGGGVGYGYVRGPHEFYQERRWNDVYACQSKWEDNKEDPNCIGKFQEQSLGVILNGGTGGIRKKYNGQIVFPNVADHGKNYQNTEMGWCRYTTLKKSRNSYDFHENCQNSQEHPDW